MNYGYARVSTNSQKLETQIALLKKAGTDKIYQEKYTGTTSHRPVFDSLLKTLKAGDRLTFTKLDRFARNTKDALNIIKNLFARQVTVHILNMGIIDDTPTGQLIFTVLSAFAQFERDMIVARTQEGKLYARLHNPNFHEGRRNTYTDSQIEKAYQLRLSGIKFDEIVKITHISRTTLYRRFLQIKANSNENIPE